MMGPSLAFLKIGTEAKQVISKLPKFILAVLYAVLGIMLLNTISKLFSK